MHSGELTIIKLLDPENKDPSEKYNTFNELSSKPFGNSSIDFLNHPLIETCINTRIYPSPPESSTSSSLRRRQDWIDEEIHLWLLLEHFIVTKNTKTLEKIRKIFDAEKKKKSDPLRKKIST